MTKKEPIIQGGPSGHPSNRLNVKKEKLKNPKETVIRLIRYLSDKKIVLALVFLFSLITTLVSIFGTQMNGYIVDNFISKGDILGLSRICVVLIIMYMVSTATTFLQNRYMVSIAQNTSSEIRRDLFENIQKLPLKYFDINSSGDLMSRLTNDIDNINLTLSQSLVQFFSGIINIVGMLIAMLVLSPILTFVGLATVPFMFISTNYLVKKTQPYFIKQQRQLGELNGFIEEKVSGQKAILLFSKEEYVKEEFSKINKNLTRSSIVAQTLSGCMGPLNNFLNNITYLVIAVTGGYFILSGMDITVGVVFSIILFMRNFTRPINEIMNIFNTIQSALAGAERVFEIMDESKEKDLDKSIELQNIKGEVQFKNVDFSYIEDKKILKDISLEADPGNTIAIVGPTGSGKTTIINLLTRFYDIDSGEILIDGQNIDKIKRESLRNSISIVLQDTYLFSVSLMENIRYGRLTATDEEVIEAAKLAHAHHFIKQLPNGYDTLITDNGSNLSHGQRQLIAIARAILSKSSILILDEATSSIDTLTEVAIQKAMANLMKGKTTFIIAHRLSTIKNADKIIALKDGKIIEEGTHDELLEKEGFYANLYNSQFATGITI